MATQRDYERALWNHLGSELEARDFSAEIGPYVEPHPETDAEWNRLSEALSRVVDQCYRKGRKQERRS